MIRELANGEAAEYKDSTLRLTWNPDSRLDIYVAAYGPKALALAGEVGDGFILQLADLAVAEWSIKAVRRRRSGRAGRDPCVGEDLRGRARVCGHGYRASARAMPMVRWMVGNHVADIVARYGADGGPVPQALTDYIAGRQGYDYNEHGRVGNTHADFVPDEIVDRFCVLGTAEQHVEKLRELKALGVDQFAVYLQHDAKEETLRAYADVIIPALADEVAAKS